MNRVYICIDLKSFYASVECMERGLDPLNTNLVVADSSRTEKTICLAVSPSLKKLGISGRARLFEAIQGVREANDIRKKNNHNRRFTGKSYFQDELNSNKSLEIDFIIATPQMKKYMNYSTKIYDTYLKYVAPEDIYAYSIDEVFCDITGYLKTYKMTPREMITKMIQDVYDTTGITATGGIGTNMYLAKIAMDIVAKHMEPNKFGVRIAGLDEYTYRKLLWCHKPITDFWRVGKGIAKTLANNNMYTMGDVARKSLEDQGLLYKLFGINAEYLIDHAWGWEPCTMKDVKSFKPKINSLSEGQVLHKPYDYEHTKLIVKEMTDNVSFALTRKGLVTDQLVLEIGYDTSNLEFYDGEITEDRYGRKIPKHAHGTIRLDRFSSTSSVLRKYIIELFDKIINKDLYVRRVYVIAGNVRNKEAVKNQKVYEQIDLFTDYEAKDKDDLEEEKSIEKDNNLQEVLLDIKNKFGKNSIVKGMNLEEGGTAIERNGQVGGHRG